MSHQNVSSKCLIKTSHQNVSSKCLIKMSHKMSHQNISSKCLIKIIHENVLSKCQNHKAGCRFSIKSLSIKVTRPVKRHGVAGAFEHKQCNFSLND